MSSKLKVLFLCTGNACRSQMAEGWANTLLGGAMEAFSAGIEAYGLDPIAVEVMAESGVDISDSSSKVLDDLLHHGFDAVVTVCDRAHQNCPIFPGDAKMIHQNFDDPPHLADRASTDVEARGHYRRVRDEIRDFVSTLPVLLAK
ncbi:MAG: arsenate reductase ArsC [Thermoanaerobaculia bacterium]